jgi:Crp-like helix-turn-helix domain
MAGTRRHRRRVPVDQRLARRLLEVGRLFAGERLPVVLALTQDEVAQLTGTTRPTANQVLKRLAADGIVRLVRAAGWNCSTSPACAGGGASAGRPRGYCGRLPGRRLTARPSLRLRRRRWPLRR